MQKAPTFEANGTIVPTNGSTNGTLLEFETNQVQKKLSTAVVQPYNAKFDAEQSSTDSMDGISNSGVPMRYDLATDEYVPDYEFDYVDAAGIVHRAMTNTPEVVGEVVLRPNRVRTRNRDLSWDPTLHEISSSDED